MDLKRGNDQTITFPGLRKNVTPVEYLNSAEVKATLRDHTGKIVAGLGNRLLTYVPSSNGNYTLFIDGPSFYPPTSGRYEMEVLAIQGTVNFRRVYSVIVID